MGLVDELKSATAEYTNANGKGEMVNDIEKIKLKFLECLDIVRGMFASPVSGQIFPLFDVLKIHDEMALFEQILTAANHILSLDQQNPVDDKAKDKTPRKNRFLQAMRLAKKGYGLCGSLPEVQAYQRELAFIDAVRAMLAKREPNSTANPADRQLKLVALLNQAVKADGAVDLFALLNRDQPNIEILSEQFLEQVKNSRHKALWLEAIQRYLQAEFKEKGVSNLSVQKDFETRLKEAMNKYRNQNLTLLEILDELLAMGKEFVERLARGEKLGLTPAEIAFYDALAQNESAVRELGDDVLKNLAMTITEKIRQSATIDWQFKDSVRAKMRIEIRRALRLFKYPPDKQAEAVEFVLKQAEVIGR
ncbi:type I site-specific restriction-modification system, restriction subunit [Actinobacillus pleuropneumoniae]|nr:type I site-specific restriction-modification system, restriction subunit [Actinobacillus pleuropneumoniae]